MTCFLRIEVRNAVSPTSIDLNHSSERPPSSPLPVRLLVACVPVEHACRRRLLLFEPPVLADESGDSVAVDDGGAQRWRIVYPAHLSLRLRFERRLDFHKTSILCRLNGELFRSSAHFFSRAGSRASQPSDPITTNMIVVEKID